MKNIWREVKTGRRKWKVKYTYLTTVKPKTGRVKADQFAIKTDKDTYRLILRYQRQR